MICDRCRYKLYDYPRLCVGFVVTRGDDVLMLVRGHQPRRGYMDLPGGFLEAGEDSRQLEMSGRKGIGVKADDLIDRLEAKSREEIQKRNRELPAPELDRLATQIARAAVRYFMVKTTTTRVIAFDLEVPLLG